MAGQLMFAFAVDYTTPGKNSMRKVHRLLRKSQWSKFKKKLS